MLLIVIIVSCSTSEENEIKGNELSTKILGKWYVVSITIDGDETLITAPDDDCSVETNKVRPYIVFEADGAYLNFNGYCGNEVENDKTYSINGELLQIKEMTRTVNLTIIKLNNDILVVDKGFGLHLLTYSRK